MEYGEKNRRSSLPGFFMRGAKTAVPIMMGYLPAGFAFGVLAREAGLTTPEVFLMSLVVYTGSSQFVTVAQMASGVSLAVIVLTCGIVNLRYLLMSASIATAFSKLPFFHKLLFGVELTDETYLVNSARGERCPPHELASPPMRAETLGINVMSHLSWLTATTAGCFFGSMLGDVRRFGLDFGLVGIFVVLLAPQLRDRKQLVVVVCSGVLAFIFYLLGMGTWSVILATLAGATLGAMLP